MRTDRLTIKAQEALQAAQQIAARYSHQELDGEHLLLALLEQSESLIPPVFEKLGVSPWRIYDDIEIERRSKVRGISSSDLFLGPVLKKALDAAEKEAEKLKDDYTSTEHLLLGLLEQGGGSLKKIFQAHRLSRDAVLKALMELRG